MISAGLEGRLPYMTYPEPWRGPPKQTAEFLRPAPKPLESRYSTTKTLSEVTSTPPSPSPSTIRYNGSSIAINVPTSSPPNGTRLGVVATAAPASLPPRSLIKYPSPPHHLAPVNLIKEDPSPPPSTTIEDHHNQLFSPYAVYSTGGGAPPPPQFRHHHYHPAYNPSLYSPYHLLRPPQPPPPPQQATVTYATAVPSVDNYQQQSVAMSATAFSTPTKPPPVVSKRRTPPNQPQQLPPQLPLPPQPTFKVPSGKEGSLKHRILTRPEDGAAARSHHLHHNGTGGSGGKMDPPSVVRTKKQQLLSSTASPPRSPKKLVGGSGGGVIATNNINNNAFLGNFSKGSLIQLASGEFRRVEDLRTEDFVSSADRNPELRLAESTVVRIEENRTQPTATVTLSYNQRRTQIEVEAAAEHPYFVFGQGWASCCPERTQQMYGLKVHRLQVGDIIISLTPRDRVASVTSSICSGTTPAQHSGGNIKVVAQTVARPATIMTTATTTAMTARQINSASAMNGGGCTSAPKAILNCSHLVAPIQQQPMNLQTSGGSRSEEALAARKRRWSAPDHHHLHSQHPHQHNNTNNDVHTHTARKHRPC